MKTVDGGFMLVIEYILCCALARFLIFIFLYAILNLIDIRCTPQSAVTTLYGITPL